jgi:hypothetical protein
VNNSVNINKKSYNAGNMKQGKIIESLMGVTIILISGGIFMVSNDKNLIL